MSFNGGLNYPQSTWGGRTAGDYREYSTGPALLFILQLHISARHIVANPRLPLPIIQIRAKFNSKKENGESGVWPLWMWNNPFTFIQKDKSSDIQLLRHTSTKYSILQ
jgi:hypothetical protein